MKDILKTISDYFIDSYKSELLNFLKTFLGNLLILLVAMVGIAILTFVVINKYEKRRLIYSKKEVKNES